jgi:hypothetical protein
MNELDLALPATASRLTGAPFLAACLLGACAFGPSGNSSSAPADYDLTVAAELRVAGAPTTVAACLRRNEDTPSYPQGVNPGFTSTETDGAVLRVTQWFFLGRDAVWTTRFVLRPAGDAATVVQVLMVVELTAAQGYQRAARELLARCQATANDR